LFLFALNILCCHGDFLDENCHMLKGPNTTEDINARNFIAPINARTWRNGVIPYVISGGFSASDRAVIYAAFRDIHAYTCVRWVPRTTQSAYVNIFTGSSGCFATLGYSGNYVHQLHLQRGGCVVKGIAIHEMLHILGFGHEQTRPDRDRHVRIIWQNIQSGTAYNFWRNGGLRESLPSKCQRSRAGTNQDYCYSGYRADTFNEPYDISSIMHYGSTAFGYGRTTIQARYSHAGTMGNRKGMTQLDIAKIRKAYRCGGSPQTTKRPQPTTKRPIVASWLLKWEKKNVMNFNGECKFLRTPGWPGYTDCQKTGGKYCINKMLISASSSTKGHMTFTVDCRYKRYGFARNDNLWFYDTRIPKSNSKWIRVGGSKSPASFGASVVNSGYKTSMWVYFYNKGRNGAGDGAQCYICAKRS